LNMTLPVRSMNFGGRSTIREVPIIDIEIWL
jgi:hypothetical protein